MRASSKHPTHPGNRVQEPEEGEDDGRDDERRLVVGTKASGRCASGEEQSPPDVDPVSGKDG